MSPKPYESLDVTAKSSTKGNCIILNIREGHSIGPYAYQLTSYGCICPNCRHKCILHVDGRSLKKAIRLWNHHASHQRNEQ